MMTHAARSPKSLAKLIAASLLLFLPLLASAQSTCPTSASPSSTKTVSSFALRLSGY